MTGYPPGYPQGQPYGQPGYPQPGQPGYPQQQPGYGGYPQQQPGQPAYPQQPGYGGYPQQQPGYAQPQQPMGPVMPGAGGVMPGYGQQPAYNMPPGFVNDPNAGAPYDPLGGGAAPPMHQARPGATATGMPNAPTMTDSLRESSFGLGIVSVILSLLSACSCFMVAAFPHWSMAVACQAFLALLAIIIAAMQIKDANKIFGGFALVVSLAALVWTGVFAFILYKNPPAPPLTRSELKIEEWMREIAHAQDSYKESQNTYTDDFQQLKRVEGKEKLMDLADGTEDGYIFKITEASASDFEVTAVPEEWSEKTQTNFFLDDSLELRYNQTESRRPSRRDPVLTQE